jgi:alpha-tubulin suppressor-like RCC1 family protein
MGNRGNGATVELRAPTRVRAMGGSIAQLALGQDFGCALRRDGAVMCWGSNYAGELSEAMPAGAPNLSAIPIRVPAF